MKGSSSVRACQGTLDPKETGTWPTTDISHHKACLFFVLIVVRTLVLHLSVLK